MGRPVILSNGRLAVGLNEKGFVHDFYFPYVGQDNLTTSRSLHHRIGIYIDGTFSWLDDHTWHTTVMSEETCLASKITMENVILGLTLHFTDWVDTEKNVFCRMVRIENHHDTERDCKIFFHQVFQISNEGRSDTAMFVPDGPYILDYKGRVCILAYGRNSDGVDFDQFATGIYDVGGKSGTHFDAEDGELSNNPVEHGSVDSVLRVNQKVAANSSATIEYWLAANDSQFHMEIDHRFIQKEGLQKRFEAATAWWQTWLSPALERLGKMEMNEVERKSLIRSLMIIKAHCDNRGGILASCDSSIYNYNRDYYSYVWPRDGGFVIWPLIRMGLYKEAKKFFMFCRDITHEGGYMMHKYQPDRSVGSTWHPRMQGERQELAIQEDETAIIVFMLGEYLDYSKDEEFVRDMYFSFVVDAANFMARFIDLQTGLPHASYDLWEEKFLTNSYTVAITYRALLVASDLAARFDEQEGDAEEWRNAAKRMKDGVGLLFNGERNAFRKGYLLEPSGDIKFDDTIDVSSLYGTMMFEFCQDKAQVALTAQAVEKELLNSSPSGGVPRYEFDNYFCTTPKFKGNPWFVTTLWLAQYYVRSGNLEKARMLLDWSFDHMSPGLTLPEQIGASDSSRVGVEPLVWSHAELVNTLLDYYS